MSAPELSIMQRQSQLGKFEFVILASLRAAQLIRGCRPRIEGLHKKTVIAQLEVAQGKVWAQTADEVMESLEVAAAIAAEPALTPVLAI